MRQVMNSIHTLLPNVPKRIKLIIIPILYKTLLIILILRKFYYMQIQVHKTNFEKNYYLHRCIFTVLILKKKKYLLCAFCTYMVMFFTCKRKHIHGKQTYIHGSNFEKVLTITSLNFSSPLSLLLQLLFPPTVFFGQG